MIGFTRAWWRSTQLNLMMKYIIRIKNIRISILNLLIVNIGGAPRKFISFAPRRPLETLIFMSIIELLSPPLTSILILTERLWYFIIKFSFHLALSVLNAIVFLIAQFWIWKIMALHWSASKLRYRKMAAASILSLLLRLTL